MRRNGCSAIAVIGYASFSVGAAVVIARILRPRVTIGLTSEVAVGLLIARLIRVGIARILRTRATIGLGRINNVLAGDHMDHHPAAGGLGGRIAVIGFAQAGQPVPAEAHRSQRGRAALIQRARIPIAHRGSR